MSIPLLPRLVSFSVATANHAGKIIRDILAKGDLGIVTKTDARDLQTLADRTAQQSIIGSLQRSFPKMTIIGEEEDIEETDAKNYVEESNVENIALTCPEELRGISEEDIVVWVDPLDGTAEYTQGLLDHVTVLIGIASGGKALAGIIHQPYFNYKNPELPLGRTIWSLVGNPVGGMTVVPPPTEGCIVTTTRSHSSSTVTDAVESVNPTEVLRVGGAGHKVLILVEGKAHAYVFASPGCKKWDTCAPQAVLEAAGGKLTDISGDYIPYQADVNVKNLTGVLAVAPGSCHKSFVDKIPQHVKDNLKDK